MPLRARLRAAVPGWRGLLFGALSFLKCLFFVCLFVFFFSFSPPLVSQSLLHLGLPSLGFGQAGPILVPPGEDGWGEAFYPIRGGGDTPAKPQSSTHGAKPSCSLLARAIKPIAVGISLPHHVPFRSFPFASFPPPLLLPCLLGPAAGESFSSLFSPRAQILQGSSWGDDGELGL